MITFKSYIQLALKGDNTISVWDGEEWQVKRSRVYKDIVAAIESVELSEIVIRDKDGNKLGWAQILPTAYGEEDIVDHTVSDYMGNLYNDWSK